MDQVKNDCLYVRDSLPYCLLPCLPTFLPTSLPCCPHPSLAPSLAPSVPPSLPVFLSPSLYIQKQTETIRVCIHIHVQGSHLHSHLHFFTTWGPVHVLVLVRSVHLKLILVSLKDCRNGIVVSLMKFGCSSKYMQKCSLY